MNDERPPQGPSEAAAAKPLLTSESNRRSDTGRTATPAVNLALIRADYWRAYLAGYSEGFQHGVTRTLDDIEAEDAQAWAELSRTVRKQASSPRYSQLCDRRGDDDRADIARQHEHRMGLDLAS